MKARATKCNWHASSGVPIWWQEDFFLEGCAVCEVKAAKRPEIRNAPTPEQAFKIYLARKRELGKRACVAARQRKARGAMSKQYRENMR